MDGSIHNSSYKKTVFLFQSLHALIGLAGIIGNMLTFTIFLRMPLKSHSYAFYFWLISWTDSIILLHMFRRWTRTVFDIDVDLINTFFCRFNEYVPYLFGSISFWLRILIVFDRLNRVVYQDNFRMLRQKWFQFSAVYIIFTLSALIHSILPLNYRLQMR